MRSVWSRVSSGSITSTPPSACRPASRTADFTWAEAIGSRYRMRFSPPPLSVRGSRPPSRPRWVAPINSSGSRIRRMGRLRSEASPVKVVRIGKPAAAPMMSRAPVPELPQSMTLSGSASPPRPITRQRPGPRRSTSAPNARMASAVRSTSSPSSRPSIAVSPEARAARIKARWDMDLSPGARVRPLSAPPGRLVRDAAFIASRDLGRTGVVGGIGF